VEGFGVAESRGICHFQRVHHSDDQPGTGTMSTTTSFVVTLPNDTAEFVRKKVASGAYASESEVIRDGLSALEEKDALETWLVNEVGPTYDRIERGEEELISIEDVFAGLEERHKARKKAT
jgi:antitoxin ParD1/3/4